MRACARTLTLLLVCVCPGYMGDAAAQEYCVVCIQPQATYRCVIGDARLAKGEPLQAFCISALAKGGSHGGCRIQPGTVFDCDGPVKKLATPPPAQDSAKGAEALDKPKQREARTPPAAIDQVTRDAARSSGETIEKASDSIGSGARKAWGCVTSFFKSC